jgi:S-adenosylmethionine decarboxylase proenzyme
LCLALPFHYVLKSLPFALQPFPYTSFDSEVDFLQQQFGNLHPEGDGSAFVMGDPFNGMQWHVYIADDLAPLRAGFRPTYNFEVCMTDLGEDEARQFFRSEEFVSAAEVTKSSGIAALKPNALIDDYVFEPCGYSMNGIDGTGLITIHITPESHQSFASVEFSGFVEDMPNPAATVAALSKIFNPAKMTVTLTADRVLDDHGLAWGVIPALPARYGMLGAASQLMQCGGKVCFYNMAEHSKRSGSDSPISLSHAGSYLSMATSSSSGSQEDSEGHSESEN